VLGWLFLLSKTPQLVLILLVSSNLWLLIQDLFGVKKLAEGIDRNEQDYKNRLQNRKAKSSIPIWQVFLHQWWEGMEASMNSTDIILHKYVDELQCDEKKWRADCCCYSCTRCCKVEPDFTTECGESLKSQQKAFVGVKLWLSLLSWNTITIAEKSSGQHFTN